MSAVLQFPTYREQPPVPRPDYAPFKGTWPTEQPTGQRKKPPAGAFEDVRQRHNLKVAPGSALQGLENMYVIEHRFAVAAFIEANRLRGLLLQAVRPLAEAFGETTLKKLTLVRDGEGFTTLYCLVVVPGALDEARRALRLFDEQWWLSHAERAAGRLNFDFDLA